MLLHLPTSCPMCRPTMRAVSSFIYRILFHVKLSQCIIGIWVWYPHTGRTASMMSLQPHGLRQRADTLGLLWPDQQAPMRPGHELYVKDPGSVLARWGGRQPDRVESNQDYALRHGRGTPAPSLKNVRAPGAAVQSSSIERRFVGRFLRGQRQRTDCSTAAEQLANCAVRLSYVTLKIRNRATHASLSVVLV